MYLPRTAFAGAAALTRALSAGACSMSFNGSDSGSSASPAASQAQKADSGSSGSAGADGSASPRGSMSTEDSDDHGGDDDHDHDGGDAEDAAITDPTWKDILSNGERKQVSGSYAVPGAGETLNLVGDLDSLTIQGASTRIAAEDVDTLTIQGSDVVVYARDIDHLVIQGSGVTVHWLEDDPDIQDQGAGNTTGKLTQ